MSDETGTGAHFAALVHLNAQLAAQLIQEGRLDDARGVIDALGSLEPKTKGNLDPDEERLLATVLTQLRMAAIRGPRPGAAPDDAPPPDDASPAADPPGEDGGS